MMQFASLVAPKRQLVKNVGGVTKTLPGVRSMRSRQVINNEVIDDQVISKAVGHRSCYQARRVTGDYNW